MHRNKLLVVTGMVLLTVLLGVHYGGFGPDNAFAAGVAYQKGDVFAGVGTGKIKHFSPTGTLLDTLDTTWGSSDDTGMAFDASGNLFATVFEAQKVSKFDNKGNLLAASFGGPFNQDPESCSIGSSGNLYVGQADGTHAILKFSPSGTLLDTITPAPESRGTDWIDLAADQCTIFYTSEGPSVKRYNACTKTQLADFATGLGTCYALKIRPNGEVMVACSTQAYRLNANGTVNMTYPVSGETTLFALNLDPDGTTFWTGGLFSGNVFHINIATGAGTAAPAFNAGILGSAMGGLAVFGEITASQPPTQTQQTSVPTMTEWGMIVFMLLAGLGSVLFLRRRRRAQL